MHDAIVVGSGPNGLTAAATMARSGWSVLVLEAKSRPGGALYSQALTLPGYLHDVGAAFFPFSQDSPAFQSLELGSAGLRWANATWESCHPAPDGSTIAISRNLELTLESFGRDAPAWEQLIRWQRSMSIRLASALLAPLPAIAEAWQLGPLNCLRFALKAIQSTAGLSCRLFRTEHARRILPALALHVDLGPHDLAGGGLALVLAMLAASTGFPVPVGGARAITEALLGRLHACGGQVLLNQRVIRIERAMGSLIVRTEQGEVFRARTAVLADTGAPALFLRLLPEARIPSAVKSSLRRFRYGWGTLKLDWALAGPVPWTSEQARASAVIHAGDSIEDMADFTHQVRAGRLPANPYLVIGQQSLLDPSRAPPGGQTLWAYTHVPARLQQGWQSVRQTFADRIENRIEQLAPGFRQLIRGRAIHTPEDLEHMDENLVGGDLGGGTAHLDHQLFLRPTPYYFGYRTPVPGVYLCSASAHPGAGVHGACGYNAARMALKDRGLRPVG